MSINWVMLSDSQNFVKLPGEKHIYKSSARTALSITTPRAYPGHNPFSIISDLGTVYLTNQRVVYLPTKPRPDFQSFSAPLTNLHDTHITMPWFGPNSWQAHVQPVPGGNIPAGHSVIELKLTFKEGGAPDFHTNFERIKERLQQAMEAAADSGVSPRRQGGALAGVNMDAVHLDELPSYEASGGDRQASSDRTVEASRSPVVNRMDEPISTVQHNMPNTSIRQEQEFVPPPDAPPGYEEAQRQSIQAEWDRRLSES